MTHKFRLGCTTALATLFIANGALADITAQEFWDVWHSRITDAGMTATFDEAVAGDILTISNLVVSQADDGHNSSVSVGPIGMQTMNDGTVTVLLPAETPITISDGDDFKATLTRQQKNFSLVIGGTPQEITYALSADEMSLELTDLVIEQRQIPDAKFNVTTQNIVMNSQVKTEGLIEVSQNFRLGSLSYALDVTNVDGNQETVVSSGAIAGLSGAVSAVIPERLDDKSFATAVASGFNFNSDFNYDSITSVFSFDAEDIKSNFDISSQAGSIKILANPKPNGLFEVIEALKFSGISVDFHIDDKSDDSVDATFTTSLNAITADVQVDIPPSMDPQKMGAALRDGFLVGMKLHYDGVKIDGNVISPEGSGSGSESIDAVDLQMSLDRDFLRYGLMGSGLTLQFKSPQMPIPEVEAAFDTLALDLTMPIGKSEAPQKFALNYRLENLSANDSIWGLFDPQGHLTHDVVNMALDITGTGNWLVDAFDEEAMANRGGEEPAELHSMSLNALLISAANAKLAGTGAFTFNNDDLETFGGVPAPTGTAKFNTSGVNALIDALIKIGLMSEEDAFGARMAMQLIAVAGDSNDTLVSEIEVTAEGHVLANGKRLK